MLWGEGGGVPGGGFGETLVESENLVESETLVESRTVRARAGVRLCLEGGRASGVGVKVWL